MTSNTELNAQRPVKASINLKALAANLERVKELAPHSRVISIIKADAYGHGVLPVAKALLESDCFAVARLDEALYLRQNGIEKSIILLEGVLAIEDYRHCHEQQFTPLIHSLEQFQWLLQFLETNPQRRMDYWLKFDTGMHRLGLAEDELKQILDIFAQPNFDWLPAGVMSHFACADELVNSANRKQLTQFNKLCSKLPKMEKSMANSAAILSIPEAHFDWVRPGIMLYGVTPFEASKPARIGLDEQLQPVMTLSSKLIAIKQLQQGDCVGYGSTWCCPEDMSIGVVAIGYGDGYPRHAPSGTPVLIHGIEVPLIGRVSMDMITVDLRSVTATIGDKVVLWGEGLPIEYVSQKAGTIAYELLCQITQRVDFEYE